MRPPSRPQLALALLLLSSPAAGQAPAPDVPAVAATGAFFALAVDDLEASTRWYVEKLGLAVTRRHPRANGIAVTILEGPGMLVELVHREGASRAVGSPNGTPEIGLFKAGLMVADFEATVAALRARGVEIVAGPFPERPDQRANVIIRDNAGNLIQVLGPASATPPSRAHHALVYHAAMGRVLLLGGSTPLDGGSRFRFFDDVWAFDGLRWTAVGTMPVAQSGQAVAYDPRDGSVLSVGGYTGRALGHVLRFRGNEWTVVGEKPGLPVAEATLAYDAARRRFVLWGGSAGLRQIQTETWELDGTAWTAVDAPGPDARQATAHGFDAGGQPSAAPVAQAAAGPGVPTHSVVVKRVARRSVVPRFCSAVCICNSRARLKANRPASR